MSGRHNGKSCKSKQTESESVSFKALKTQTENMEKLERPEPARKQKCHYAGPANHLQNLCTNAQNTQTNKYKLK